MQPLLFKMSYSIPSLPLPEDVETKKVLKAANLAHRYLAELKGTARTIPNENILINTLVLQEAQDSSAVENIITTQDELYRAELFLDDHPSAATKEVQRYAEALRQGFEVVRENKLLTLNHILKIHAALEQNSAGLRSSSGTRLVNETTKEVVYVPPQHRDDIRDYMSNLVDFINNDELSDLDPLVKMAIIHHQFESIHPFYDGNGRTGRIINILYLVAKDLLELPILYLSRYVIHNKDDYYRLLQAVRDEEKWEDWLVYMLTGVAQTAADTITLISEIKRLMQACKIDMRTRHPRIYSQDLLNNLFRHPYTKIDFIMKDLQVNRATASKYLRLLMDDGWLILHKVGRSNYYINHQLVALLQNAHHQ